MLKKVLILIFFALTTMSCKEPEKPFLPDVEDGRDPDSGIVDDNPPSPPTNEGFAFVKEMGVGWNLGNTMDTKHSDKTYWGNPPATKGLIDAISAKGFKTLRVPITWQYNMSKAPNYTIEGSYLKRIEEIVNYGLDNKMYVIINIHHDEEIIEPTYAKYAESEKALTSIWRQVAQHFQGYDHHLIFESLNEMRVKGSKEEWTGGTAEGQDCINKFHSAMVKTVREVGGQNAKRKIMLSTYAASGAQNAVNGLKLPDDDNILVAIHNYFPYLFAMAATGGKSTWGTDQEKRELDAELDRLVNKFISQGIPVVMGEWGSINRNNLSERVKHAKYYVEACLKRGICPVWWDNGVCSKTDGVSDTWGLIDRKTYNWVHPEIADIIVSTYKN